MTLVTIGEEARVDLRAFTLSEHGGYRGIFVKAPVTAKGHV